MVLTQATEPQRVQQVLLFGLVESLMDWEILTMHPELSGEG